MKRDPAGTSALRMHSSWIANRSVLRALGPRFLAWPAGLGLVAGSMPDGLNAGRPFRPLSLAISARRSATACFKVAFSASKRSVKASSSLRDRSETVIFSGADMLRTKRVRTRLTQPLHPTAARPFAPLTGFALEKVIAHPG